MLPKVEIRALLHLKETNYKSNMIVNVFKFWINLWSLSVPNNIIDNLHFWKLLGNNFFIEPLSFLPRWFQSDSIRAANLACYITTSRRGAQLISIAGMFPKHFGWRVFLLISSLSSIKVVIYAVAWLPEIHLWTSTSICLPPSLNSTNSHHNFMSAIVPSLESSDCQLRIQTWAVQLSF